MNIGLRASDFVLLDTAQRMWRLSDRIGKVVVLLFYPGDETLVCTRQLCSVRDNWMRYLETGAEMAAISPGTEDEHRRFAENHELPMTLLADGNRSITRIYANHRWLPIWATRAVIVVDAKGVVRYKNVMPRAFRPTDDEILAAIYTAQYDDLAERRRA